MSRPLKSAAELGKAILMPGSPINIPCGLSEWCAAAEPDGPVGAITVSGTDVWPPDM